MIHRGAVCAAVLSGAVSVAGAQEPKPSPAAHVMMTGAQMVVLTGDPGAAGPFTLRAKLPAGYKVPAHWHPTDEHVTVIEGTFSIGMGDAFDMKALRALPVGGFTRMPAEMRHFAFTEKGTTIQVHGMGPFALNYVNPADDPRNATAPAAR